MGFCEGLRFRTEDMGLRVQRLGSFNFQGLTATSMGVRAQGCNGPGF